MRPIEIALDAALLVMRSGGSTPAAERSFSNLLKAWRQESESVVWRLDFVAASRTTESGPVTVLRGVGPIGVNLHRASEIAVLADRAAKGEVEPDEVETEVARIRQMRSPYPPWLTVAVAAAIAACFVQIPGSRDWGGSGIAFVAAGAGQFVRTRLQARETAVAPVTFACGLLSALIAAVGLRLGFSDDQATILLGAVIYLVPGLPLINGFLDMMSHRHLFIGAERMLNATFLFLVLGLAIAVAHNLVLGGL
jgi:uncharacterized membrane protein YjjP (DUF1212 family)